MAGTIIVSNLKTDTDNSFIVRSNTGATLFSCNTSGLDVANTIPAGSITSSKIASVANTQITGNIISSQIAPSVTLTTPLISGNLNFDANGTSGIRLTSANTITFHTTGTEDVRIDANGNVGIGVTSTTQRLNVLGSARLSFNGGDNYVEFESASNYVGRNSAGNVVLNAAGGQNIIQSVAGTTITQATGAGLFQFNSGYGSVATAYGCRAWVNFNGTGTPAIRGSGNVSSITDQGVGLYKVNFTTDMPDINYSAVSGAGHASGDYSRYVGFNALQTTSGVEIRIAYPVTDGTTDSQLIMVSIFR
jgi:hypothetical protein